MQHSCHDSKAQRSPMRALAFLQLYLRQQGPAWARGNGSTRCGNQRTASRLRKVYGSGEMITGCPQVNRGVMRALEPFVLSDVMKQKRGWKLADTRVSPLVSPLGRTMEK